MLMSGEDDCWCIAYLLVMRDLFNCLHEVKYFMYSDIYAINAKTYQFTTQCNGDISHAFKTTKITVFDPMM